MNQPTNIHRGKVTWQSPSNIALVKYWGKHGIQLPINPSLSITLEHSNTTTQVKYQTGHDRLQLKFSFEGKPAPAFGNRIEKYLRSLIPVYPVLQQLHLEIDSSNTFPHSSGIASSASAFSALALCILTVIRRTSSENTGRNFLEEASELARLGSGSASRSIYPGYVVWGSMKEYTAYSDHFAVPVQANIHTNFLKMMDAILIVNSGQKKVGSSAGHALMNNHPFLKSRLEQAHQNMTGLHEALQSGDYERFISIVENEALSLHGLMLSSNPGYLLMESNTYQIIEEIRKFRSDNGIPVCFTLDAGPNVHLIYPAREEDQVRQWIRQQLLDFCSERKWIDDGMGDGPFQLENIHE